MAKHAIFRSDLMHGTTDASSLVNILIPEDLDNCSVLKIGAMVEGEHEVFVGEMPAAEDALNTLCIIAAPEVMYDEKLRDLADFYNMVDVNGGIVRGYRFHSGDIFSCTKEAFTGDLAVGSEVNVDAAYKMAVGGSGTKIGEIIAQEGDYFVVRVLC